MLPKIRLAEAADRMSLANMRSLLWPDATFQEHLKDVEKLLQEGACGNFPAAILVAQREDGSVIGFLDVGMRSHADGCNPERPVGYVEGWFVQEMHRNSGAGRQLMQAAEEWARARGCVEMASDTWIDNLGSQRAHEALGFEVVDRCVNYRKTL
jgi:aminoglycoside 6'-N-acetyltransferase I